MRITICILILMTLFAQHQYALGQNSPSTPSSAQEAKSLDGQPLFRMQFSDEQRTKLETALAAAEADFEKDKTDLDAIIWYGRRLAYLWRYNDAIKVFSSGIELHPNDPRCYRHRGHRFITIRKFDKAIKDFETAAKLIRDHDIPDSVEEDGQPNSAGIPTSTLYTNVYYHLGLAHYLKGDYRPATKWFLYCLEHSNNNDMKVATIDWLYMCFEKLSQPDLANEQIDRVHADWKILENHAYHKRILMYKGELDPDDLIDLSKASDDPTVQLDLATYGYGIGNWYVNQGQETKGQEIFERVTKGKYWSAFGYIAAECELARMRKPKSDKQQSHTQDKK